MYLLILLFNSISEFGRLLIPCILVYVVRNSFLLLVPKQDITIHHPPNQ